MFSQFTYVKIVTQLAELWSGLDSRGPARAVALIEEACSVKFRARELLDSPLLQRATRGYQVAMIREWLRAAGPGHPEFMAVANGVIERIRTIRDEELPSLEDRIEFVEAQRGLWHDLKLLTLHYADRLRQNGDAVRAAELELAILEWAEEFTNRAILLRMQLSPQGESRTRNSSVELVKRRRALAGRACVPHVQLLSGYLPPSDPFAFHTGGCMAAAPLRALSASGDACGTPCAPSATPRPCEGLRDRLLGTPTRLQDLLPDGTVVVRTVFDHEGSVRWWALQRQSGNVRILAAGRSKPEALRRLEHAVLRFDLDVEGIWNIYEDECLAPRKILGPWIGALSALDRLYASPTAASSVTSSPESFARFQEQVQSALDRLAPGGSREATWQYFTLATILLLNGLNDPTNYQYLISSGLLVSWRRILGGLPDAAPRHTQSAFDFWRIRALDEATVQLVAAAQAEINLGPLWTVLTREEWRHTHVLFQLEGPLLAVPFSWATFGGADLFRQVASTSSVVSLALRHLAENEATRVGHPGFECVSALWLPEADWSRMQGLATLELALLQLADQRRRDDSPWECLTLGDAPLASAANVRSMIANRRLALAVVGGHGSFFRAGVNLADGFWQGDGADLSKLGLLVLCACAVGRFDQRGDRDVQGLCSQLFAHQGRSVVAARWPIVDAEAATFIAELAHQYMRILEGAKGHSPHVRAKALNEARKALLDHPDPRYRVSHHLASAFELYGLD